MVILAALSAVAVASAQSPLDQGAILAAPATHAVQTTNGDFNKVVCRTEETTGTRLGTIHVCMTKAQWEDRSNGDGKVLETNQIRSYLSGQNHD